MPRDSRTAIASASVSHRPCSTVCLIESLKGLHLSDAVGKRLSPGTVVNLLPVSSGDANRSDCAEQIIHNSQAFGRREAAGPQGIAVSHFCAAEMFELFPPLPGWRHCGVGDFVNHPLSIPHCGRRRTSLNSATFQW